MSKLIFRKKQARQLSLLALVLSLFIFGIGFIIGDIALRWGVPITILFTLGAYIIGGYHDPNDPNPQD